VQGIAQLFGQLAFDDIKGPALVVAFEVFHVLQQERGRPVVHQDAKDIEKQRTLRLIIKAMRTSEGILFGHTRNRERLTGKPGYENIVFGNVSGLDLANIALYGPVIREVRMVGGLREAVPLRGKHTAAPRHLPWLCAVRRSPQRDQ